MKVLIVGNGGREHALAWKIAQSPRVSSLFCAPGNAGVEQVARCVTIAVDDVAALKAFVIEKGIDLTVVGPEGPLALGIVDEFRRAKLRIFGPTRGAALIESSKIFSKDLMARHRIPTASGRSFDTLKPALEYLERQPLPIVVKADGLAQGKGVVVATTREDASRAVSDMLEKLAFGQAGRRVVIEEFLDGEELTVMAFTDGNTVVPMAAAQDHKRVGDGDTGPNTGGMGAYAPAPIATPSLLATITRDILHPVVEALARLGSPFHGVLYAGLMIVRGRPYVLEFNARFGDPETQVVLPLLKTDLVDIMEAVVEHRLDQLEVTWHERAAVCVVLTSAGYPGSYATGLPIGGLPEGFESGDVMIFHAGTKRQGRNVVTAGGRVLGVTGIGPHLEVARERAYNAARKISFQGCHLRSDIANRALASVIGQPSVSGNGGRRG
ncbi:MAG: phosphoribosylamine--glycine ligase [Nitrospirae bacterium]|nr:phosphoribosylamine--glycine ligase [Nitrospirota bacterium]